MSQTASRCGCDFRGVSDGQRVQVFGRPFGRSLGQGGMAGMLAKAEKNSRF